MCQAVSEDPTQLSHVSLQEGRFRQRVSYRFLQRHRRFSLEQVSFYEIPGKKRWWFLLRQAESRFHES